MHQHRLNGRGTGLWALAPALALGAFLHAGSAAAQNTDPEVPNPGPPPGRGEPGSKGVLTLQFDNDMFGGTDQHFTHGTRFAWLTAEGDVPEWVKRGASYVPLFSQTERMRASFSIGQNIFTPDDITERNPDPNDRPYAGWLYAGIGLVSEGDGRLDNLELDIGVVGPYSFAEEVQTNWHDLIGIDEPEGWRKQLHNEPGIVLYYSRSWRLPRYQLFEVPSVADLSVDAIPHINGALGNVFTFAGTGVTFRLGSDLRDDYGPPRIRPNLPGTDYFGREKRFGWYVFAGLEGRMVLRNIFLDGNTFQESRSVDKELLVGDLQLGFAVFLGPVRLSYTQAFRTREFKGQPQKSEFGSMSLSIRF